jgi:hypothetical protein
LAANVGAKYLVMNNIVSFDETKKKILSQIAKNMKLNPIDVLSEEITSKSTKEADLKGKLI